MIKNLVIVESPAKAKTIGKFLGKDYEVKSSYGHVRDLPEKDFGINVENNYEPEYVISPDKKQIISELKKIAKKAETVWLASDEDREGEAISWHLAVALELTKEQTKRIVFHEITKTAIEEAINHPRNIDMHLVDAQQARRVLDRMVGFELSPILWKKIKPALSAGRVQSVAVRLIVEREKEIKLFQSTSYFKITALFIFNDSVIKTEIPEKFSTKEEAIAFLEKCKGAAFSVGNVEIKPAKKSPSPPFTTSTLQQEASRKLGFSVTRTMVVAQQLYESGLITYMRTDSVNLSNLALDAAKEEITKLYGKEYVKTRQYTTKSKGAQEAHEAIRPSYISNQNIDGNDAQKRLYDLIWKRTIASQMKDAEIEKTVVTIDISTTQEKFVAKGEVIRFEGFLKVYSESTDDDEDENESLLPPLKKGDKLRFDEAVAIEKFTKQPARYTEASLVKKLEELGIGRPSTYAPTISTIQKRGYVLNESRDGFQRNYFSITLKNKVIAEKIKIENTGYEKSKLFPTDTGTVVNDFLNEHFNNILDYNFTADIEKEFDEIAQGERVWNEMIKNFYVPFHKQIDTTNQNSQKTSGERLLGKDPKTGKNVYARIGRFGSMIQIGEKTDEEKPKFASLIKGQSIETITMEEAMILFTLPRSVGEFEDAELIASLGRFGPYIKHKSDFYSLKKTDDPYTITKDRAIELIIEKRNNIANSLLKEFSDNADIKILQGKWGPYIKYKKKNFRMPKTTDIEKITLEECIKLTEEVKEKPKAKAKSKK